MPKKPPFPPTSAKASRPPTRTILFVIYPCFQILDAAGPIAAFEIADWFSPGAYRLRVASIDGGLVASSSGVAFPSEPLKGRTLTQADTVVVVGGVGTPQAAGDVRLIRALQRLASTARRIASVCSGSFVLAAAGLLEGKTATTHWAQAHLMQRMFPTTRVEADRIYVKDGAVWSSAGVSVGIDLALAMISEDLGAEVARTTARSMVVYSQRPGGQTQHSTLLEIDAPNGRFSELHAWMRAHVHENLCVERLAQYTAMSPRNFARAYVAETGVTPAKAVERIRVETARALIQSGGNGRVQEVASATGFGDPERMRRAFIRVYGAPPTAMKRLARHA